MKHLVFVPAILVLALGGCGGSTSSEGPTAEPSASVPTQSASVSDDGGCSTAAVDGTTTNAELLALATDVYASLQCGTDQSLSEQLEAAGKDPAVTAQADDAGLTMTVDSAAGGTVMSVIEGQSACTVTVLDSADAKSLSCLDL